MRPRTLALPLLAAAITTVALVYGAGVARRTDASIQLQSPDLLLRLDSVAGTLQAFRVGEESPFLTQNAGPRHRPYLHPIVPADGRGAFTEASPDHHPHQTGLYWGFTRLNGRDFFHNPGEGHWRRVSLDVVTDSGSVVAWQTVYDLLDETGDAALRETQIWTLRQDTASRYLLDLEWRGEALKPVTVGAYDYGGLFLRMPWKERTAGSAVNAARQRDAAAEGRRSMWLDVGMVVEGRQDPARVAIFDHPDNGGYPHPWRVDGQLGVGPARARLGDWSIARGETEVIRHRLVFGTGPENDVDLLRLWEEYTGRTGTYTTTELWELARQEGFVAEELSAGESVARMTTAAGFQVNAWAAEPLLTQPMAFAWDDRGRLWIAENRDYESRGGGFSASGDSRIVILEDTDRDGVADSRKVFLEGIPFPSAIAVGFGGAFVGAPPHLLFVPDRDGDDRADADGAEILLTGWGIRDRHETLNSLSWGPDGWLYGLEGFATPSRIRPPTPDERVMRPGEPFPEARILAGDGVDIDGGVWRYHPVKRRFEVVAHGFSNPWGIDYDAKGQLFITACVLPHVFHVIPGGIYQRQGGRHFNPYVYSDIQHIVDHRHRSAHGGARIYQSDAFPAEQRGRLFMANIHEHTLLSDVLDPVGSGFVARHGQDVLQANNAQWIGFSVEVGPDGALYVLDWHDPDLTGGSVTGKETGRVYRVAPSQSLAQPWDGRYADLSRLDDVELAQLQRSASDWHARRARVILQGRAASRGIAPRALALLRGQFAERGPVQLRLRAMWALHLVGGMEPERMLRALADREEYVRGWAVQLLTEDGDPGNLAKARFATMARRDRSPVVRKYLAAALQRLPLESRAAIATGLLAHAKDADDHNLPHLIWFGIEPLVASDATGALALAGRGRIPLVNEHLARRAVDADSLDALVAALRRYRGARVDLLRGMRTALEGRRDLSPPAGWDRLAAALERDREAAALAREVSQQFGDASAARRNLAILADPAADAEARRQAIEGLALRQDPALPDVLPGLLSSAELRVEAIRAVAAYDLPSLGEGLLRLYPSLSEGEKREAVQAMASRTSYGRQLTYAIRDGRVARRDVPADVARRLLRVVGAGFVEVWGPIELDSAEEQAAYARYRALLGEAALATADVEAGRQLFARLCGSCHVMEGVGGTVGPELTGSNRQNVEWVLGNVLRPGEVVQDDYRMVVITMRDGRTHMGNVIAEDGRLVTLRVVGQEPVVLAKGEIQSREVTDGSLMPEGLLRGLSDQEVVNLFGYLRQAR